MSGSSASSKREVVTMNNLPCSRCGTLIQGNSIKMCLKCEHDITASIPKVTEISYCPECDTYKHPVSWVQNNPESWVESKLQNNELLSFLVNNFKCFTSSLRLVHAEFIWTNSNTKSQPKIIRLKLVVETDNLITGSTTQQECTVEYLMHEHMCGACLRAHVDPNKWVELVVLRCRALESIDIQGLIADHHPIWFEPLESTGFALFFDRREKARGLEQHLCNKTLTRIVQGEDFESETNLSVSIEICPVSQGDLICLPGRMRSRSGGLRICSKVSREGMELLDPVSFRVDKLGGAEYWESPFEAELRSNELVEYVVLEVGNICYQTSLWTIVRNVRVARVSDYGKNDTVFYAKTHLVRKLFPGDHMLGYHLIDKYHVPHVFLIKRSGREEKERIRARARDHIHDKSSCHDSMDSASE